MPRLQIAGRLLRPGVGIKRWLLLLALGGSLCLLGASLANRARPVDLTGPAAAFWRAVDQQMPGFLQMDAAPLYGGISLVVIGVVLGGMAVVQLAHPGSVLRHVGLAQGPRVVVIGGGTGLSTMLRGLKEYTSNITAVVTVTDDGGSSGKLQRQFNMLPPGDIRNCLVALAETESDMTDIFYHRFSGPDVGEGLVDHNVGNLLIAALTDMNGGDFEKAIQQVSRVLKIKGQVLPSTLSRVQLTAVMENGEEVTGETTITKHPARIKWINLQPADAVAPPTVCEAIDNAEIIVFGPGSVYTSIIPNLLVRGIPEAIMRSKAIKVYVCNVMTQPGETTGFTASQHVEAIAAHVAQPAFRHVIINTAVPLKPLLDRYRDAGSTLVVADADRLRSMGYQPIAGQFISQMDVVRHDPSRLAEAIMRLYTQ